jgi:hypothetical protein
MPGFKAVSRTSHLKFAECLVVLWPQDSYSFDLPHKISFAVPGAPEIDPILQCHSFPEPPDFSG